jgi:hypothetical protein
LRRTISICFVNGVVFRDWPDHHTCFRLLDRSGGLCLTEDLEIHIIELPKFQKTLAELEPDLDFWLYFLKNGEELDADALPAELDRWEIRKAMGVLKMLAQSDVERELYEGRLKAKRDMQTLETERRVAEEQRADWQQRYEAANREREAAKRMLVRQIQLCERLLGRRGANTEELTACSLDELHDLAERLERESAP